MPFVREPDGWYFVQGPWRRGPWPNKIQARAYLELDGPPEIFEPPKEPEKPRLRVVRKTDGE